MPIAEGIAAARLAMDAGSKALDLLRHPKIDGEQVRARLVEMQDLIFSAQRSLGDADDEAKNLRARIVDLERYVEIGKGFEASDGVYWHSGCPYCPVCWDVDRKPVRLSGPHNASPIGGGRFEWSCALHGATFAIGRQKSLQVSAQQQD